MANVIHRWRPGEPVTCTAAGALTGGRFVAITTAGPTNGNPTVNVPGAGATVFGVAAWDTASGADVTVLRPGGVTQVEAGATLAAGDKVQTDSSGRAIVLAAGIALGVVVKGAASAALAEIDLRPDLA